VIIILIGGGDVIKQADNRIPQIPREAVLSREQASALVAGATEVTLSAIQASLLGSLDLLPSGFIFTEEQKKVLISSGRLKVSDLSKKQVLICSMI